MIARATTGAAPRCTIFRFRSRSSPCWGAFIVAVALIQIGILRYAYLRIGVSSRAAMALLLGSLLGGEQLDILAQRAWLPFTNAPTDTNANSPRPIPPQLADCRRCNQ